MIKPSMKRVPPKIITKKDYEYFRNRAQEGLLSEKIKEERQYEAVKTKQNLIAQSMTRKEKIREIDMKKTQKKSTKLDKLHDEAKEQAMHLLERANHLKIEQEEEILLCNKLILQTKCRAIRDLQVAEKKLIEKELKNEEKRLNEIMLNNEKLLIEKEKREANKSAEKQRAFARQLRSQIIENEEQRIIEFERKQEEARLTNLNNIAWQDQEIHKANTIKAQTELMKKQMLLENETLIKGKEIEREENRILDMRIQKYQREKEERDKNIAEAQRIAKMKKDAEKAQVAMTTVKMHNLQEQIDELNMVRMQEEVEREWRNREKAEALKRLEARQKLAEAREEQMKCRQVLQAMDLEHERRAFNRILEIQKDAVYKDEKLREKKLHEASQHRAQILKQIDEKYKEKIENRKKVIEEGLAINMQAQMRANKLKDAIERKCNEMRDNKVPEMYINNVKALIDKII